MVPAFWDGVLTSADWLCGPVPSVLTAGVFGSLHDEAGLAAEADALVVVVGSAHSKLYKPIFYPYWSGAGDSWGTKPNPKL